MSGSAAGRALDLDLSGVALRLAGLAPALARRVATEWDGFVSAPCADPFLRVDVAYARERAEPGRFLPKAMGSALSVDRARFWMPEGRAEVRADGRAAVRLLRDLGEREYYTLANLLRACLAWRLPSRGGMLLHSAGLVVDGRAFLLVGAEGSGKSTWARLGEEGGARVLSDDLVPLDAAAGRLLALGSPFRSTHRGAATPGRWPLAAILFPRHGSPPAALPVGELLATARLAANLTFVAEGLDRDERIAAVLRRAAARVACAELTFAPEPSFLGLLRDWPAGGPPRLERPDG